MSINNLTLKTKATHLAMCKLIIIIIWTNIAINSYTIFQNRYIEISRTLKWCNSTEYQCYLLLQLITMKHFDKSLPTIVTSNCNSITYLFYCYFDSSYNYCYLLCKKEFSDDIMNIILTNLIIAYLSNLVIAWFVTYEFVSIIILFVVWLKHLENV